MSTRLAVTLAAIGVLLAGVLVALVVVIVQLNAAAAHADHERRVAICEETVADEYGDGLDAMARCLADLTP